MFFPYNTDAPIYYWPYITVCLIVVNALAFAFELANPDMVESLALEIGGGLNPAQWLTNNFMHADPKHLLGNMISLWAFGLVVEGKLGPWKTLFTYLGIGVVYGATVQILMLGGEPGHCLGASAIIFAFMAMCLIWAPENTMSCFLLIYFRPIFFEMRIWVMVLLFLVVQIVVLSLTGGQLSSEFLHTVGAALGFGVGIVMLKKGWVDCEDWDVFSVMRGHHRLTLAEKAKLEASSPQAKRRREEELQKRAEEAAKRRKNLHQEMLRAILDDHPKPAFILFERLHKDFPGQTLPESDLMLLLRMLLKWKLRSEAIAVMQEYLAHYTEKAIPIRLKLAQVFFEHGQPLSSLKVLNQLDTRQLGAEQHQFYLSLRQSVERMKTEEEHGFYELAE